MSQLLNHISFDSSVTRFLAVVFLILILSFVINLLLGNSILGPSYRIFVAPGVIIHELSHAFLCLLTGARITKLSFFEKNGGHVEHSPPKIPIVGQILISLAPFFIGAGAIYFLSKLLGLTSPDLDLNNLPKSGFINVFIQSFNKIDYRNVKNLIIVYLVLSIAVTMTPSVQDIRNIFISILILGIGVFLVDKYTSFNLFALSVPAEAFSLLSTVLLLLIFSLIISIVIFGVSKMFKPV